MPQGQPGVPVVGSVGTSLSNLGERLVPDIASNALIFRGREDEVDQVRDLLALVDVQSSFISKWYPVGNATSRASRPRAAVSSSATRPSSPRRMRRSARRRARAPQPLVGQHALGAGDLVGSGFILYPDSGGFVYRGTTARHAVVNNLISQLRDLSRSEEIVYEFYKLKHGKAEDIAATMTDLINSTQIGRHIAAHRPRARREPLEHQRAEPEVARQPPSRP